VVELSSPALANGSVRRDAAKPCRPGLLGLVLVLALLGCQRIPQEQAAPGSLTGSTHDLSLDEAEGGHTLHRHVGRTDEELTVPVRYSRPTPSASATRLM
jgi:hypothetical protein